MLKDISYMEPTAVDPRVFEKLVSPDHYLRRVQQVIDCARLRDLVMDCDSPDLERTAEDPVRLIQLACGHFHYRLSARGVIAEAQVNGAFRFFLELSLESRMPVPSLLSPFRTRLGRERDQGRFDHVVTQVWGQGLVHDRWHLKDAPRLVANIAVPTHARWSRRHGHGCATVPGPMGPSK